MLDLNPLTLKAAGLAAAAALVIGFGAGWTVNGWRCEAGQKAAIEAALTAYKAEATKAAAASTALAKAEEKIRVQTRVIRQNVDRVVTVYRDRACLDPGGVQLVNEALGAATPGGQPDRALPSTGPAR